MADTTEAEQPAPAEGTDHERLGRVESAVDRIEQALSRVLPTREEAQEHEADKLDRPSNVAEQVRAELDKAKREQEAADRAAAERGEMETLKERVARLAETPPAPPSLRRVKVLGWGDGRS
jgi:hypothetical protein